AKPRFDREAAIAKDQHARPFGKKLGDIDSLGLELAQAASLAATCCIPHIGRGRAVDAARKAERHQSLQVMAGLAPSGGALDPYLEAADLEALDARAGLRRQSAKSRYVMVFGFMVGHWIYQ